MNARNGGSEQEAPVRIYQFLVSMLKLIKKSQVCFKMFETLQKYSPNRDTYHSIWRYKDGVESKAKYFWNRN